MMKGEPPIEIKILVPSLTVHSPDNAHSLTASVFRSRRDWYSGQVQWRQRTS